MGKAVSRSCVYSSGLLSSPEAFARTLHAHAQGLEKRGGPVAAPVQLAFAPRVLATEGAVDPDLHGLSDEAEAEANDEEVRQTTETLGSPTEDAVQLLSDMRALAEKARRAPDAKVRALFAWMRENLWPALGLGEETKARRTWSDRRVILFTEYADTKRYLVELLTAAAAHTDQGELRIGQFHGRMGRRRTRRGAAPSTASRTTIRSASWSRRMQRARA